MIIKICKVLIVPMYHYTSANCAELQKNCKPNYRDDNFKALRTIFRFEIYSFRVNEFVRGINVIDIS